MTINKQFSLVDVLAQEMMTISAVNEFDYNLKRVTFSFTPRLFPYLKTVKFYDGSQIVAVESNIIENRFTLNFTSPKRPGDKFGFKIIASYLKPFIFVPYKLQIKEDQKIEFKDDVCNIIFEEQTQIEKVYGKYQLPNQVHSYTKELIGSENKNSNGDKELVLKDILPPFQNKVFTCHYTHERSFETLTSAKKVVQLSMWGNLSFDYDFRILNEAAELDGELSNIDFQSHLGSSGRSALRQIRLQLPRDIWRLSLADEVGNLTRPMAKYQNDEEIDLVIVPRFSLFGAWKSTFWISYNQHSDKYLFQSKDNKSLFRLDQSFNHILGFILTKDYTLSFCIPEFATFKGFESPFAVVEHSVEKSYSLFEYFGKNCYTYKFKNIIDRNHKKQISIYFEFDLSLIYMKLFYVIAAVTALFGLIFVGSRVDLDFKPEAKVKTE